MKRTVYLLVVLGNFVGGFVLGKYGERTLPVAECATTMRVTAYCAGPCCCKGSADGITANGYRIRPGEKFCAAPKSIPFGTMIEIPGYGTVPVWDRGSAITEGRLDVFFDDAGGKTGHQRALKWGTKNLQVRIRR